MKKIVFILFLSLSAVLPALCRPLTIEECRQLAQNNYPLIKQYALIGKTEEYTVSNAGKGYLPQFSLSGKATYQSDVTEIPVSIPGVNIKELRKDQYQAALEMTQLIWDGGAVRAQKSVSRTNAETDLRQLEVEMYSINDRVDQLFFGILLQDALLTQNALFQAELERNYRQVEAYVENGIANQADLDAVKVEQLNTTRKRVEMESSRKAYREMLSMLTGVEIDSLVRPADICLHVPEEIKRPELLLFNAQDAQMEARLQTLKAKNFPKFSLFIQGLYGNPGLDMLKNEFTFNYIAGIRFSWNFGTLYTRKNESRLIGNSRDNLQIQKETFLFNTGLDIKRQNTEIEKLITIMKNDDEVIRLRTNIQRSAEAKAANGTLSVIEMLREITARDNAVQDKNVHEIQLLMAIYNLKYTTNN